MTELSRSDVRLLMRSELNEEQLAFVGKWAEHGRVVNFYETIPEEDVLFLAVRENTDPRIVVGLLDELMEAYRKGQIRYRETIEIVH